VREAVPNSCLITHPIGFLFERLVRGVCRWLIGKELRVTWPAVPGKGGGVTRYSPVLDLLTVWFRRQRQRWKHQ
jgi:hypothetical protein